MKQAGRGLNLTRKREFLAEMEHVVPWAALVGVIVRTVQLMPTRITQNALSSWLIRMVY